MKRRTLARHRTSGLKGTRLSARAVAAAGRRGDSAPPRRQQQPLQQQHHHHHVYVVLLDAAAGRLRKVRSENPRRDASKPCVYVGMTGLTPEERFANHKAGIKDAWVVQKYGERLLPELYAHLNPMPFEAAAQMEKDLAEDLRLAGYTVAGGH